MMDFTAATDLFATEPCDGWQDEVKDVGVLELGWLDWGGGVLQGFYSSQGGGGTSGGTRTVLVFFCFFLRGMAARLDTNSCNCGLWTSRTSDGWSCWISCWWVEALEQSDTCCEIIYLYIAESFSCRREHNAHAVTAFLPLRCLIAFELNLYQTILLSVCCMFNTAKVIMLSFRSAGWIIYFENVVYAGLPRPQIVTLILGFNPLGTGDLKFYKSQGLRTFWWFFFIIKPVFYLSW